jgi:hypothetical protein
MQLPDWGFLRFKAVPTVVGEIQPPLGRAKRLHIHTIHIWIFCFIEKKIMNKDVDAILQMIGLSRSHSEK